MKGIERLLCCRGQGAGTIGRRQFSAALAVEDRPAGRIPADHLADLPERKVHFGRRVVRQAARDLQETIIGDPRQAAGSAS